MNGTTPWVFLWFKRVLAKRNIYIRWYIFSLSISQTGKECRQIKQSVLCYINIRVKAKCFYSDLVFLVPYLQIYPGFQQFYNDPFVVPIVAKKAPNILLIYDSIVKSPVLIFQQIAKFFTTT